jgi:C4-dicarboxylate-specific signal transduction histidine kinase
MNSDDKNMQYDAIGEAGLRFFGKVSASIAHEMKNVLAIINENAGLLEDLTFAAQRGSAIDPERLNKACRQFTKQIHRADTIIKNMSHFAHSVDHFAAQIDLHELAGLIGNLAGRPAAMRKLTIQVEPPRSPVVFTGNPFLVENLIWLCLEFAFGATSADTTLILKSTKADAAICLKIAGIDGLEEGFAEKMPAGSDDLLAALGARLSANFNSKELNLHLA